MRLSSRILASAILAAAAAAMFGCNGAPRPATADAAPTSPMQMMLHGDEDGAVRALLVWAEMDRQPLLDATTEADVRMMEHDELVAHTARLTHEARALRELTAAAGREALRQSAAGNDAFAQRIVRAIVVLGEVHEQPSLNDHVRLTGEAISRYARTRLASIDN